MPHDTDEKLDVTPTSHHLNFSAIPNDIHEHHIALYCDYPSLVALASTKKIYWQLLIPELERRRPTLAVKVVAGANHTFVFTESGLYDCGYNHFAQLGLDDNQNRLSFTPVTAVPSALRQQGRQYQQCQRLIDLCRQGLFSPTSTPTRQEVSEESTCLTFFNPI